MSTKGASASLLGIPTELRLYIYANVTLLDADFYQELSEYYIDDIVRGEPFCQDIRIPWSDLRGTCKLVSSELRSYMSSVEYRTSEPYRTWEIDVSRVDEEQTRITRLRIPCKHRDVDAAIITIALPRNQKAAYFLSTHVVECAWQCIWEALIISGPRMNPHRRLWPQLKIHKCTFNIQESRRAEDDRIRPDMTMYYPYFSCWHERGYFPEEAILNMLEVQDGKRVLTGRICLFGSALVEVMGFQRSPMQCHQASVDRWIAYKQQKSLK